jgi:agmatinase
MTVPSDPGAYGALEDQFCQFDESSIVIIPVPYDGTSTWRKGSSLGPKAILEASANMELYDIETDSEVFRRGIVTMDPVCCPDHPEAMVNAVYETASRLSKQRKFIVGIGGEHSVSVGLVRAASEKHDDLSVLQLDAHADTRDAYEGTRYNHACVMSRIGEICPYVQVGIRSMDSSERKNLGRHKTVFAHELQGNQHILSNIHESLSQNVYITIDLDVLDPSCMPSTGTPEPGGLDWYTLIRLLESVIQRKTVVAMDVTELLPNSANKAPDFLAAKLIYRVLSMVFLKEKQTS